MIPDFDVLGFSFGVRYGDFWGHRGFTHSLVFAALLAGTAFLLTSLSGLAGVGVWPLLAYYFVATASHGILDAMTDGGLGVALLSPFHNERYFFPWTPIRVAPIGVTSFFSARGWAVLQSEIICVWIPAALLAVMCWLLRREGS